MIFKDIKKHLTEINVYGKNIINKFPVIRHYK